MTAAALVNNGLVQDPDGDVFVLRVDSMMYGFHFAMHDCMILPSAIPVAIWPSEAGDRMIEIDLRDLARLEIQAERLRRPDTSELVGDLARKSLEQTRRRFRRRETPDGNPWPPRVEDAEVHPLPGEVWPATAEHPPACAPGRRVQPGDRWRALRLSAELRIC